jgi:anti-sigma regulatory factor (Ser/Thr protein kinase)
MRPNQWPSSQPADRPADGEADGAIRLAAVTVPAAEAHIALVRLAVLHVAALVGLEPGRAADLRLAVAEACGQYLAVGPAGSPTRRRAAIAVRFERLGACLRVTLRGPAPAEWPHRDGLGWLLLSSLVGDLRWAQDGGVGTLVLVEHLPASDELSFAVL